MQSNGLAFGEYMQKPAYLPVSSAIFDLFPESLLIHFFCDVVRWNIGARGEVSDDALTVVDGSSAGSADAVLVKAFKTRNANMGERSRVPPSGGIIPRNMFKYGSHRVLKMNKTFSTMYAFDTKLKIKIRNKKVLKTALSTVYECLNSRITHEKDIQLSIYKYFPRSWPIML